MSKKRGIDHMEPQVTGAEDSSLDMSMKCAKIDQPGHKDQKTAKNDSTEATTSASSSKSVSEEPNLESAIRVRDSDNSSCSEHYLSDNWEDIYVAKDSDDTSDSERSCDSTDSEDLNNTANSAKHNDESKIKRASTYFDPTNMNKGLSVFMKNFEKVRLSSDEIRKLPRDVRSYLQMADFPFESASINGTPVSKQAFSLAGALIHKSYLLELSESKKLKGSNGSKVNLTEKMLAYLTYVSVRLKDPSVNHTHFDQTEALLKDLQPDHPSKKLFEIAKEEFPNISHYMPEKPSSYKETEWKLTRKFYDKMFYFNYSLDLNCKLFLILFNNNMESKSLEFEPFP